MIKPKYKLGDIVYTMCANEIVKCLVVGILLSVKNDTEKHTVNDVFEDYIQYTLKPIAEYVNSKENIKFFTVRRANGVFNAKEDEIHWSMKMLLLHLSNNAKI